MAQHYKDTEQQTKSDNHNSYHMRHTSEVVGDTNTDTDIHADTNVVAVVDAKNVELYTYDEFVQQLQDQECTVACASNMTVIDGADGDEMDEDQITKLTFLTNDLAAEWLEPIAKRFTTEQTQGRVRITFVKVGFQALFDDTINEARRQLKLYDGFVTPPTVAGSVVEYNGWDDLTPYINEHRSTVNWADILLGYRENIAQYEGQIIMFPLDGDLLNLFYRKDILKHFNLSPPRTWAEYSEVAKTVHGQTFENQTLVGSCIGRVLDCAGAYWANLVIASMTQTQGPWSGHLFDTSNLDPLSGPVLVQALQWMEEQAKNGASDEFSQCFDINFDEMYSGKCVMTYNWGNSFKRYMEPGSQLIGDRYGIAPTPGSTVVLDRDTKELVPCDATRCKFGKYYDDIGWVNRAPYLAFGGWGCAINNYTDTSRKLLASDFCAFASSKNVSIDNIIPDATGNGTKNGQDPYRLSHVDNSALSLYVERGYEQQATEEFLSSYQFGLDSENLVVDIRFPTASKLNSILDTEFHNYLNETVLGLIPEAEQPARRLQVSESITQQWEQVITDYDNQGSTQFQILEIYQRLRGVYAPEYQYNQLGPIRGYGYALVAIIFFLSLVFSVFTAYYRKSHVVRASQPIFLMMICFGTAVLGAVIIPFGIDDGTSSDEAASQACMAMPWLLGLGWTIVFSALFAKIWRVNIVYRNSMKFRRLQVSEMDVLLPFGVMFTLNLIILLVWTLVDPLVWERINLSELESYGTCTADSTSATWQVCIGLLAVINGAALFLANFQAYQARTLATEYGESRYIGMAMLCILQVVLIGIPLLFLVNENPPASYFVRVTIVFVICFSILTLIFVPKLYYFYRKNGKSRSMTTSMARSGGLTYRVLDKSTLIVKEAKIKDMKRRLIDLKRMMEQEGINASAMLDKAGLSDDLVFSSAVNNSHISDHEAAPTRPMGSSSGVSRESKASVDGDCGNGRSSYQKSVAFADENGTTNGTTNGGGTAAEAPPPPPPATETLPSPAVAPPDTPNNVAENFVPERLDL